MRKLLLLSVALLLAMPTALSAQSADRNRDIGFTWWNDVPETIRRGNEAFSLEEFESASEFYRDAQILHPQGPVSALNLGISEAKQGNTDRALNALSRALQLSGEDATLRSRALYNLGVAHLENAIALKDDKKREAAVEQAIAALDAFDETLRLEPDNEEARFNREQVRHLLNFIAEPPPPQEQQQQQQGESGGEGQPQQQDSEQEQEQQQDEQQQQQQQQQESGDQQEQQQPEEQEGDQEQQQQQPQDGEEEQGSEEEQRPGGEAQPQEQRLSPEEARQLLNLLGDMENIVLQKRHDPRTRPTPEKNW